MGITNLIQFFQYFNTEVVNLITVSANFNNIKNLGLSQKVVNSETSMNNFFNNYKTKKIKDGEGNENTPYIITNLNQTETDIRAEFLQY